MIMKRNIKTFLSARPLCCYLIAAITLALSFVTEGFFQDRDLRAAFFQQVLSVHG